MTTLNYVQEIAKTLDFHKAHAVTALNVSELTVICEYMIIASGRNANQTRSLSEEVEECMEKLGRQPHRIEGRNDGRWIVLDYGEILVELFNQEEREYYKLERLWEDGSNRVDLQLDAE